MTLIANDFKGGANRQASNRDAWKFMAMKTRAHTGSLWLGDTVVLCGQCGAASTAACFHTLLYIEMTFVQ